MILGIGSDLTDIRRIETTLERFGERFLGRCFTDVERRKAAQRHTPMGVVNLPSGQPTLHLTGGAAQRLAAMTPEAMTAHIHLSMTDDPPYAQAFVVIEAR